MKKVLLLIFLLLPITVYAYSNYIIPGGETLGIEIKNDGILIVGFYKVNGQNINRHLKIGDKIIKVANTPVEDVNHLTKLLEENIENNEVTIEYKRNNEVFKDKINLDFFNGNYRTGLYVKGTITGIGTLTYIDPETNVYASLGHVINESKTNQKVEVRTGFSYDARVTSFTKSINGVPGSKNADILKNKEFGKIYKNTNYGVYGITEKKLNKTTIEVGNIDDVIRGKASIYTTNINNEIEEYTIDIIEIDKESQDKNYYFEVSDSRLIDDAGGIVQGMSGSPIVQNNKIIGAVTRVLVDDVKKGYGINIKTMLEEGDRLQEE